MTAGTPGNPARYYSSTAVETSLQSSIPAQSQGQQNTSFIVGSISGFPTSYPYTLIVDPDTSKEEVLTVTAGSGTTLTVTRGVDSTQAVAHSAGAVVRHGVSGRDFRESQNHMAARGYDTDEAILTAANQTHVHGLAVSDGVVVGTTKAQTVSNKVFIASTLAGAITSSATVTVTGAIVVSGGTITGLSSAGMVTSSATPKDYVDAILGSATAASTSAAAANTSAVAASTSAANASASASAASTSAAAANTSAVAASTSVASASTSAAAASTSAANASASAAAANTSAVNASTSAANASASAASATTSQAAANTSAVAASTSAANALVSANSASAAASQAASAIQATIFDAKGDIIVASAADTAARLGVGTDGQILTAASTATYGLQWAAAPVSLPSQSGNAGKYLTTDGSTASWAAITTDPTPTVFLLMGA